jgi:hypothetical protein
MHRLWLLIGLLAFSVAKAEQNEVLGIEGMKSVARGLPSGSFDRFYSAVHSNRFLMPVICSPWATNLPMDFDKYQRTLAARDFGEALFSRIEEWGAGMKAAQPKAEPIKQFMDIADWLMKSPGYGNFFMAKRCHEITIYGIARALVETNCPLDDITNQFVRFDAWWKTPAGRARILNDDVGARLFEVSSGDENAQQQYLERMWTIGKTMVYKYSTPEVQAAFEGHPPPGYEDISKMVRQWFLGAYETPFMREHVSFFKDDGKVSAKNWDVNDHEALIAPYQEPQLARLKCLAQFRAAIGYFPGEYVPNEDPATSKQKAAFVQAWTSTRIHKGRPEDTGVAVTAWEVYRDILSGAFPG